MIRAAVLSQASLPEVDEVVPFSTPLHKRREPEQRSQGYGETTPGHALCRLQHSGIWQPFDELRYLLPVRVRALAVHVNLDRSGNTHITAQSDRHQETTPYKWHEVLLHYHGRKSVILL